MIKVYKINLNGKVYEVEVESVTEKEGQIAEPEKRKIEENISSNKENGSVSIEAPMQGIILDILVSKGDQVKKNEPLIILEAMKMENQIVSPESGTVSNILVSKGDTVDLGKVMITLE